jgi:hypothetical protein
MIERAAAYADALQQALQHGDQRGCWLPEGEKLAELELVGKTT